jgi:chaperonin cofactor prefoldin
MYSLGNKAYLSKQYDEAIARYSEAIALDPDNHIYYSNRSACHGAKGDWASAAEDATVCLRKDPGFLKGYYRLTLAQMEMKEYDAAVATIKAGLQREPGNTELQKQLRLVKAKKNAADYVRHADSTGTAGRGMSQEELSEVQEQWLGASKELKEVRAKGVAAAGEKRRNELTLSELAKVDEETRLFRSVGKMFVLTPRGKVLDGLQTQITEAERRATDVEARHSYLEAKVSNLEAVLKESAKARASA